MGNVLDCSTAVLAIQKVVISQEPVQAEPTIQDGPPVESTIPALEQEVPLMESKIWSYLRDYYKRNNAVFNANPETPTFISNSSYIADVGNFAPTALIRQSYANVILKFLSDWYRNPAADKSEPVYILEGGAGQGRLAYLILKKLTKMQKFYPEGVKLPFVYI